MHPKREAHLASLVAHDGVFWQQGCRLAGIDEVGRGPLAGCVLAACVVMPSHPIIPWVDDSKSLSEARREIVYEEIIRTALFVGIGRAQAQEIDEINILQATRQAMRRAAHGCGASLYLIDAERNLGLDGNELAIIKGDATSYSIAAASIVAKVVRDREIRALALEYPGFYLEANKGYGTPAHLSALKERGPCPLHRRSFLGKIGLP